jgi:hypothetical protein
MATMRSTLPARQTRRMCLHCGYGGRELQSPGWDRVAHCPCCDGDLYTRTPLSYAQMEGLDEMGPESRPRSIARRERSRFGWLRRLVAWVLRRR